MIKKAFQFIYSLYAFILFISIMFIIFPFAILASFFGRIKGGNMIMRLCMVWADLWYPLVFIRIKKIYEAPHQQDRPYIFVANHISYLDATLIPKAFRQPIRPLGKVEMGKVPVFGFIYRNAIVSVDRSNPANRAKSIMILKSIIQKGISVLVFPEGTFNLTTRPLKDFYDGAFRIAIETQTPIKPVLFLDAYRRLGYERLFSLTPGTCRILYLPEIPVKDYSLHNLASLKNHVYKIMEEKMIAYDGSWRKTGD